MPGIFQKLEETRPFRGIMGCDALDFGLLASRPVGWYISVVLNHPSLWYFVPRTLVNKYNCLLPNYRTHHLQSQDLNPCLSYPQNPFSQLLCFTANGLKWYLVEAISLTSFTEKVPLTSGSEDENECVEWGREGREIQTEIQATYERHKRMLCFGNK